MAETAAITGKGTTIGYGATTAGPFTDYGEVTDIPLPETTVGSVEATHYESPDDTVEKLSVVWQENSDLTFTLNYVKALTTTLYSQVGDELGFQITLPDGSTFTFPGMISRLGGAAPNKDKISQSVTITIRGKVTFAAGA